MPDPAVTPLVPVLPVVEGENITQPPPPPPTHAAPEPGYVPDGSTPPPPQSVEFRWRNNVHQIPLGVLDSFAGAIGAPSREAVITWTQQGRDINYNAARLNEERAAFERDRRDFEDRRAQLEALAADLDARSQVPQPSPNPWAPGFGPPTQPGYPQGGSAYGAYPTGYPAQGGYPPAAPPWGATYPQDPNVREQVLFQALTSIPQQVTGAVAPLIQELRAERAAQARSILANNAREQEAQLNGLASDYITKLQNDGFDVSGLSPDVLIRDVNELGLSANPNMTWTRALEVAAGQRLWRGSYQLGRRAVVSELENNREASFQVPPTRPNVAPPPPELSGRIAAARAAGENITMREALGR